MTAMVILDGQTCPECGANTGQYATEQDALFIHGGYGATSRTVQITCPECGWTMVREVSEVRPPRSS